MPKKHIPKNQYQLSKKSLCGITMVSLHVSIKITSAELQTETCYHSLLMRNMNSGITSTLPLCLQTQVFLFYKHFEAEIVNKGYPGVNVPNGYSTKKFFPFFFQLSEFLVVTSISPKYPTYIYFSPQKNWYLEAPNKKSHHPWDFLPTEWGVKSMASTYHLLPPRHPSARDASPAAPRWRSPRRFGKRRAPGVASSHRSVDQNLKPHHAGRDFLGLLGGIHQHLMIFFGLTRSHEANSYVG